MKHTDFNDKLHEIWQQEVDELKTKKIILWMNFTSR